MPCRLHKTCHTRIHRPRVGAPRLQPVADHGGRGQRLLPQCGCTAPVSWSADDVLLGTCRQVCARGICACMCAFVNVEDRSGRCRVCCGRQSAIRSNSERASKLASVMSVARGSCQARQWGGDHDVPALHTTTAKRSAPRQPSRPLLWSGLHKNAHRDVSCIVPNSLKRRMIPWAGARLSP